MPEITEVSPEPVPARPSPKQPAPRSRPKRPAPKGKAVRVKNPAVTGQRVKQRKLTNGQSAMMRCSAEFIDWANRTAKREGVSVVEITRQLAHSGVLS